MIGPSEQLFMSKVVVIPCPFVRPVYFLDESITTELAKLDSSVPSFVLVSSAIVIGPSLYLSLSVKLSSHSPSLSSTLLYF